MQEKKDAGRGPHHGSPWEGGPLVCLRLRHRQVDAGKAEGEGGAGHAPATPWLHGGG